MARALRIQFPFAWYHVYQRGARRQPVWGDVDDRLAFLALLDDAAERHGLEIHAYSLMDNHLHLLGCTPRGNLAKAMHRINGVYTQRFNRRHGFDGALFQGRYNALLVDSEAYLLELSRYIHRNPVEAGMVQRPEHHQWSSYAAYIGLRSPETFLHVEHVLQMVGGRDRYSAFVNRAPVVDSAIGPHMLDLPSWSILGTEAFQVVARERSQEWAAGRLDERWWLDIAEIEITVCRVLEVSPASLVGASRGRRNLARMIVLDHARNRTALPVHDLANRYGLARASGVAMAIQRLHGWRRTDASVDRLYRQVRAELRAIQFRRAA